METQLIEKTLKSLINPDAWMFPLRVALSAEGFFEIWTRYDNRLGSRNNFALATGIQGQDLAEWICAALNQSMLKRNYASVTDELKAVEQIFSMWESDDHLTMDALVLALGNRMPNIRMALTVQSVLGDYRPIAIADSINPLTA